MLSSTDLLSTVIAKKNPVVANEITKDRELMTQIKKIIPNQKIINLIIIPVATTSPKPVDFLMICINRKQPPNPNSERKSIAEGKIYIPFNINMMPCISPVYLNLLDTALKVC